MTLMWMRRSGTPGIHGRTPRRKALLGLQSRGTGNQDQTSVLKFVTRKKHVFYQSLSVFNNTDTPRVCGPCTATVGRTMASMLSGSAGR